MRSSWFDSGYSTCVSRRCFWLLCHTFPCESRPRILRSIHVQTSVFLFYWEMTSGPHLRLLLGWREARVGVRIRPCGHGLRCHSPWLVHLCSLPYVTRTLCLAVTSVSASPEKYKKLFGLGDGFTQLGSIVDARSRVRPRSFCGPSYLAATCSVLYVALERLKMWIFLEITPWFIFAFSAFCSTVDTFCVSLRGFGTFGIFHVKVSLGTHSANCVASFLDKGVVMPGVGLSARSFLPLPMGSGRARRSQQWYGWFCMV